MTGLNYSISAVVVTVLVTEYSVLGGLWSVTLTDAVQWVLIVLGIALLTPSVVLSGAMWFLAIATQLTAAQRVFHVHHEIEDARGTRSRE